MTISLYHLEYFLLILVRISGFMVSAPIFSLRNIPMRVKTLLALALAIVVFHIVPYKEVSYSTTIEYTIVVIKEMLAGVIMGFLDVQFHRSFSQYTVTTGRMYFRGSWYTAYEERSYGSSEKQFAENFSDFLLVHSFFREEVARHPDQVTVHFSRVQSSGLSTVLFVQSSFKSGVPEFFTWETGIFQ